MSSKVSIIVPVFNASTTLRRCLDSIICQSYKNIEVILVDDGSTDESATICDEYASADNRLAVFHKQNGGVSSARNAGIDIMTGEWLVFVDSDDWIDSDYLERLVGYAAGIDFVVCNSSKQEEYSGREIIDYFSEYSRRNVGMSWSQGCRKLIRSSLIKDNGIKFDSKEFFGEDTLFILDVLKYVDKIRTIKYNGYHISSCAILTSEKYNLSSEAIIVKNEKLRQRYKALSLRFNSETDPSFDIRINISMFRFSRILEGKLAEYQNIWFNSFPEKEEKDFWCDNKCSPTVRSITYLKYLASKRDVAGVINDVSACRRLWGDKYKYSDYPYLSHRLIGNLMWRGYTVVAILFILLYMIKK